jgi:hypothetical protein
MTYDTGSYLTGSSYMTGSEIDRRTSLGSDSAAAIVGAESRAIDGESNEARNGAERALAREDDAQSERSRLEPPPKVVNKNEYAPPSDSGLGTDCPTAMLSGGEDYFR